MVDEQEAFQDFLELTPQDFRLRYKPQFGDNNREFNVFLRRMKENPPTLNRAVFKETDEEKEIREENKIKKPKHISHIRLMSSQKAEEHIRNIEQQMRDKKVSESAITQYLASLRQVGKKDIGIETQIFLYKGKPLTSIMFNKEELDISLLNHRSDIKSGALLGAVESLEQKNPGQANTHVLRQYVENLDEPEVKGDEPEEGVDYFPDLAIGSFDLELTHRRREIYAYWEEVAPKFQMVIDASKAIIAEYDSGKLNDYKEFKDDMDRTNRKSFYSTFEALVGNVENPSGENNFVLKIKPITVLVDDLNEGRIQNIVRVWFDTIEQIEVTGYAGGADYSKDKEDNAQRVGWQEDEGVTDEEVRAFEAQERELNRRIKDEIEGGRKLLKTRIVVDPLLYYLIENNKIAIGAYSKDEADIDVGIGIKRAMRRVKKLLGEFDDDTIVEELEEYVDRIKARASDASHDSEYYLPYTQQVKSAFIGAKHPPRDKVLKLNRQFLIAVNTLIQPDNEADRTMDPVRQSSAWSGKKLPASGKSGVRDTPYPEPLGYTPGQRGRFKKHTGKMKNLIKKLIKAIDEYYVDPSNSQHFPFHRDEKDDLFSEIETAQLKRTLEVLWDRPKKGNWKAMSVLASKFNRNDIDFISHSQMVDVVTWHKKLKNYDGRNIENQIIKYAQNAFDSLEEVFGNTLTQNNKIYFAYYIDLMARKNGNDISGMKFPRFGGEFISELVPQYSDREEEYPIKALRKFLGKRKSMFTKADESNTQLSQDRKKVFDEYFELTKVTKSAIENNILDAHDTIRKINGKPIYYAFGDTSDFDDVNNTIDIVKKSYNVELMPVEIENIVDDFNSHETLSKKYGLSQEVIYRVKAMYR